MNMYPKLLLRLLHLVLGKGSQFFGQTGTPVMMILYLFLEYFITCGPLCRAPQDITLNSFVMNVPVSGESPKVDKPPESSC
jgi:hypothetical protein